ncbi:YfcC family protein, partial [candidate division KSB1 bacterium]|nr:YfcC family protein [candidate division KSB1 bacterium]
MKLKIPHTLVLILIIMLIVAASTWIIPGGQYLRQMNPDGREVVVDDSFIHTERNPQGLFAVLQAPLKGMSASADIISFILIVGGVFSILQRTRVIDAAILRLAERLRGRETIIIPVGMLIFSVFGAVFGMSEEVIPFVLIFIPMALATGYDSLTGVAIPFLGAGVGFAGALLNPFTIGIAQGIAELPLFSGLFYRLLVWIILTTVAIAWVTRYAVRVKRNPQSSPVYALDQSRRRELENERAEHIEFSRRHRAILWVFGATIVCMAWGVMQNQWFIAEISGLFLGLGIASGLIAGLSLQDMADAFVDGARDLIGAAFVVGFARAILIIASDGQVIDTLMHAMAQAIRLLPSVLAAQLMMVIQTLI